MIREPSFQVLVNEALDDAIGASFDLDARQIAELGYGVPIETAWFSRPEELGQIEALSAYSRPDAEALVELDIIMGVHIVFVVESDQIARTFSDEPDVWPEHAGMSWDDLRGSNGISLGTVRLAHVRAEASIAMDDGRLNRLVAVSISLASPDEIFQEPSAMTEGEARRGVPFWPAVSPSGRESAATVMERVGHQQLGPRARRELPNLILI